MKNHVLPVSFLVLAGMAVSCVNERPNLSGHVDIGSDSLVVLAIDAANPDDKGYCDTIALKDGHFQTYIPVSKTSFLYLKSIDEPVYPVQLLFLPGDRMKVEGELVSLSVSGTELYDSMAGSEFGRLQKKEREIFADIVSINKEAVANGVSPDKNKIDSLQAIRKPVIDSLKTSAIEFIKENPDNILSGYITLTRPSETIEEGQFLGEKILDGPMKEALALQLEKNKTISLKQQNWENLKPGTQAPDFRLKNLEGKYMSLESFKGKYILLDFWGTWCGWCIKGFPDMKKYYDKYKDRIEFVGIDCRDTEEKWREGVAKHDLPWTNLYNGDGQDIVLDFGIQGYPSKIIIDPDGKVVDTFLGEGPELYKKLDELFR